MARYIDADDLKAVIYANDWSNPVVPDVVGVIIDRSPTADVAPRAEVAREILADIRDKGGFNDPFVEYICLSYDELIVLERKYTATTDEPPKGD
jgi:hypothetical protein